MTDAELLYVLALQGTPKVGDILAKRLLQHCGNAEAVFREKPSRIMKIEGIGSVILKELHNSNVFRQAEQELKWIREKSVRYYYYTDSGYPELLRQCADGPILLFYSGNIELNGKKAISIVGTRNMTSYGKEITEQLVKDLVPFDPVVISGFAYGVDIIAHKTAIEVGLPTVACLAHGLNQTYPKSHSVYRKSMEERGGFLTDFWSSSGPDRENFLRRNRLIAGLSEATVVIESAEKGGALVTAYWANSYNREVFAVPGRTYDRFSKGCHNLIKTNQAHILTGLEDLVYHLGWNSEIESRTVQTQLFIDLDATEQQIHDFLKENDRELLDHIALGCKLPIHQVSTSLLTLELKGLVRPLPGKLFELTHQ